MFSSILNLIKKKDLTISIYNKSMTPKHLNNNNDYNNNDDDDNNDNKLYWFILLLSYIF